MSRAVLILNGAAERARAIHWIGIAPAGTRVEFKQAKRTIEQNSKLWAMLTDVATQVRWGYNGEKLSADAWKDIFMHGLKRELHTAPSLDRSEPVALGRSSSDLSKEEFSDLLELITEFGARNGVVFHDPQENAA
jgi:hypothetical protein